MVTEQEHQRAIAKAEAELQVDVFLGILQERYGLQAGEIREILDDIRWVRGYRSGTIRAQRAAVVSVFALVLAGLASALWEGIKQSLRR
jgi:hypothetical protein